MITEEQYHDAYKLIYAYKKQIEENRKKFYEEFKKLESERYWIDTGIRPDMTIHELSEAGEKRIAVLLLREGIASPHTKLKELNGIDASKILRMKGVGQELMFRFRLLMGEAGLSITNDLTDNVEQL